MRNLTNTEATDLTGLHVQLVDPATGEQHKTFPADQLGSAFKDLNRWYVDPNGSAAGTGASSDPKLTIAQAYSQAGQGDTVVVNEGVYNEAVTLSTQNTTLAGASGAYGSLTQIAGVNATASGTSVRVSDLTVTGAMTHTGTAPLYLNNVTVGGAFTGSSNVYREIRDSSLQDGGITVTAGTTLIEDSKIGNATFSGSGTAVSLRNVTVDPGECITIGAGVVYLLADVTGCVNINAGAIPAETALIAAGLTPTAAEAAVTTSFSNLRITNPDFEASPTKVLTYDTVTGEVEYSDFPQAKLTTTSLTPVVYDGGWVGAQADIVGNLAKEVKLSDGTIIASGLVTWTGHGLTVGETYYTSQTTAGAYVTPEPTSGLSQKLFTVIDANTIDIQVQEGVEILNDAGTSPTDFAKTVYVNATSPSTATIFDLNNPPATNDNTLKADSQNIYIGTDGSTWTYNSATGTYTTYTYPTTVPHGVYAQRAAGFSVATGGAGTTISGYTTGSNTAGTAWNPTAGTFTVEREGWYDISASLMWAAGNWNANGQYSLSITVNGAGVSTAYWVQPVAVTSTFVSTLQTSTKYYLKAGDVVRVYTWQSSGSAKTTYAASYNTFSIVQVA